MTEYTQALSDSVDQPALWDAFTTAPSDVEYYQAWLDLQSSQIDDLVQALLVVKGASGQFVPAAGWAAAEAQPELFAELLDRVLEEQCGLLLEFDTRHHVGAAYPIFVDGKLQGVVCIEVRVEEQEKLQQCMYRLQWGTAWLELLVRNHQIEDDRELLHRARSGIDLLALTLKEESFGAAAAAFVTELGELCGCERVSLGFVKANGIRIQAVSHSTEVGEKMNLTRALERVMDEAIMQRNEIVYPAVDDELLICREHEELSRQQSMASIVTFPLFANKRYYGAVTCERAASSPFLEKDIAFIRAIIDLVGPVLESKRQNEMSLVARCAQSGTSFLGSLIGAAYLKTKIVLVLLLIAVGALCTVQGEYRLNGDTVIEGAIRRAIVVPFDGFIKEAPVQAGDLVQEDQLLCGLDDQDLRLEQLAKMGKRRQLEKQYQETIAKHDRANAGIIKAQLDQAEAELELIAAQLARTRLTAPFDGLIVQGDLSQRLGSAVEQGEVVFELTPLDSYRLLLQIDERRIRDVHQGQKGSLVLAALPGQEYHFTITKITPITQAAEGRNFFRVEAALDDVDEKLRPGMEGIGKIAIDKRRYVSIWTRDFTEWLTLAAWKWLP